MNEYQKHIKNDAIACRLQDYDSEKGCFTCYGNSISSVACVVCYHFKLREARENARKIKQ